MTSLLDILKSYPSALPESDSDDDETRSLAHLHTLVSKHYEFICKLVKIVYLCQEHISQTDFIRNNKIFYVLSRIETISKNMISNYNTWRMKRCRNENTHIFSRCSSGRGHGWDVINRVMILESELFCNCLFKHTRKQLKQQYELTPEEKERCINWKHPLLVFGIDIPIYKLSGRSLILQLRYLGLIWSRISRLSYDTHLRSALNKIANQCRLRFYCLVRQGVLTPEAHKIEIPEGEVGLNSTHFEGRIMCTPQNNCGISIASSFGTWFELFVWMSSRQINKLQTTLYRIDLIAPMQFVKLSTRMNFNAFGMSTPIYENQLKLFTQYLTQKAIDMIDNNYIQSAIINDVYLSIMGIDSCVRNIDISHKVGEMASYYKNIKQSVPTSMNLWIQHALNKKKSDFFLEDPVVKYMNTDFKSLSILLAFDYMSRKDGTNTNGFIIPFYIRIDHEAESVQKIENGMDKLNAPCVIKIGSEFMVKTCGRSSSIACRNIYEALYMWCLIMKNVYNWRFGELNYMSFYADIFNMN